MPDNKHPPQTSLLCDQLLSALQVIGDGIALGAGALPPDVAYTISSQLTECRALVESLKGGISSVSAKATLCDLLREVQQVIQANDPTMLVRRLTHRVSAARGLPYVSSTPEQVRLISGELLSYAVQIAAKGSSVNIGLKEVPLRQGSGVECTIVVDCAAFSEQDRYRLFEEFSSAHRLARNGSSAENGRFYGFALCRQLVDACLGQLWVEIPSKGKAAFTFVLPCVRESSRHRLMTRVKCDIIVGNYQAIRESHGVSKASDLLRQLESAVRKQVRSPMDAVAAFEPRGVVSAIMELPHDASDAVVGRLRELLDSASFHAGRHPVSLELDYQVATIL